MFVVVVHDDIVGTNAVRGAGRFAGQTAIFLGPEARERAEAYARWLNGGATRQQRRTDPER